MVGKYFEVDAITGAEIDARHVSRDLGFWKLFFGRVKINHSLNVESLQRKLDARSQWCSIGCELHPWSSIGSCQKLLQCLGQMVECWVYCWTKSVSWDWE